MENNNKIRIEDSQYEFITQGFIRPVAPIRRFSQGSNRFYYTIDENGEIELYSSGTTLIKDGYAESEQFLEEWRNKLKLEGKDPKKELSFLAMRGTLLHTLASDYIQQKQIKLADLNLHFATYHPQITSEYLYNEVISKDSLWLQKGIMAFAQFVKDYNVRPLAIELMLSSEKYKVASPVDMICTMDYTEKGFFGEVYKTSNKVTGIKKGDPKESKRVRSVTAIVDFKSSQTFYDKHFLQLQLYKRMVKENYPDIEITSIYNWSPKDWTGSTPTYNLKEQTSGKLEELCEVVFEQGRIKHVWKNPTVNIVPEHLVFGQEVEFKQVPLRDYLKELHNGERDTAESRK